MTVCQVMKVERGGWHRELWSERDKEDEEGENRMALCA